MLPRPTRNPDPAMNPDEGLPGFVLTEPAPAKVNLALHVVGQRPDGYHLLDMLVTFTRYGDRVGIAPAASDTFTLSGRFAQQLKTTPDGGNLVLRARDRLRILLERRGIQGSPVHLHLEKNLPIASGIGGGSADAAATLRGLMRHWRVELPEDELAGIALELGADVPMCLASRPLVARGIGEQIAVLPDLPAFAMVLVNPLVGVSTPEIFRRLENKNNPALNHEATTVDRPDWLAAFDTMRNDLEQHASEICPEVKQASLALKKTGARIVRMSGSGATCFGIYDTADMSRRAAEMLEKDRPDWFVVATETLGGNQHHGTD